MRLSLAALALFADSVVSRSARHARQPNEPFFDARPAARLRSNFAARDTGSTSPPASDPSNGSIIPQTNKTEKFKVNGAAIPDIHFDVGESYAGRLPVSDTKNAAELYFWFFPTSNEAAKDEILIWLNGGPGCSSLEGWLQENGPALWNFSSSPPIFLRLLY